MFRLKYAVLLLLFVYKVFSQGEFQLQEGTVVKLANTERAKELLTTEDEYTAVLSRFDLDSKTQKTGATLSDYLNYSAQQSENWSESEVKTIGEVVASVNKKIADLGLNIKMPGTIEVIKSTMANEGGADGYTRGNYIVLKKSMVEKKSGDLENLFIHELFHVLSRNDKTMSEKIYNSLGFKKTNEVAYPKEIADLRISNPDAPLNNYYITVKYKDTPYDVMLILYSESEFKGGSFFFYLKIGMLAVEGSENNKQPVYKDGRPLILSSEKVNNFYEQVGKNTNYIFHAEEMSADHFVMLLNQKKELPNPELIEAMKNVMK